MTRKKIVFVIVEGPSDSDVIEAMLNKILDKNTVYVHITHGDITTEKGTNASNILSKIGKIVKNYIDNSSFKKKDIKEIVHVIDTDGAYIDDNYVIEDSKAANIIYSLQGIICNNKSRIVCRNKDKSKVLNRLIGCDKVFETIPYSCYYMSCNIDHVLYNKMNSTDEEKENDSIQFVDKYENQTNKLITFMTESNFSVMDGYHESWKYIKEDLHSIERNTNFGIYLRNSNTNSFIDDTHTKIS